MSITFKTARKKLSITVNGHEGRSHAITESIAGLGNTMENSWSMRAMEGRNTRRAAFQQIGMEGHDAAQIDHDLIRRLTRIHVFQVQRTRRKHLLRVR
ncbi:MAG: hypothetical protein UT63_C0002G0015 [Candidatus Gottesmanbacteria bacterium GW2011_GWC2_39_8]|uniref:Uncharacterized protein n=1 Tax=Candidatus Gottesmanbacteria bacterium GW2011_GWC2_39_8 TaxID=1618450 RepID=A0A0G0SI69_9BACT|nr:MAG: hypothetical protein UT63_C0002G0015 [Candidatus Gottesmanbacteria bacterium GW2011_GWC2_39_8]